MRHNAKGNTYRSVYSCFFSSFFLAPWFRPYEQKMATGEIEIHAESVETFNVCQNLPFEIKDFVKVSMVQACTPFDNNYYLTSKYHHF